MPEPEFIAENSRFFENLLEHRFLHDLGRWLVTSDPPRRLNILRAEVDQFGFDLVLSVGGQTRQIQMKTRSGGPPSNSYAIAESLWAQHNGCVVWMLYDQTSLEPTSYYLLGPNLPPMDQFRAAERSGYRAVKMQRATHRDLTIAQVGALLFGEPGAKRTAFFFGSGISYNSKAPSVSTITKSVLTGPYAWHTSEKFVPAPVSDQRVVQLQQFLEIVRAYISPRLGDRPADQCNYEDLYAAITEVKEHANGERPNPLVAEAALSISKLAEPFAAFYAGNSVESPFPALCSDAIDFIQQVAFWLLSNIPVVKDLDRVSEVASKVHELVIFTLNHDQLVERQLRSTGHEFADGFGKRDGQVREFDGTWEPQGKSIRLLKLHGSIDWFRALRPGGYQQYVVAEGDPDHLKDGDGNWINLYASGSPRFLSGVRVKARAYSQDVIGEIFRKFRDFSSQCRTIIFCGYGFADHEINERLFQWLLDQKQNKAVILHHDGEDAVRRMPFWIHKLDRFKPDKVEVISKWLYECSLADLEKHFDAVPLAED